MKSRLLIIIGMITLPMILPQGFSQCIYNDDWPDAPCFDTGPVSHLEFNKAWAPYYDHKGSEWMENKRIELNQVLEQGTIEEWVEKLENHNVYQYYLSRNEIQSSLPYDSFFVKYDPNFEPPTPVGFFTDEQPSEWLWFVIGGLFMLGILLLIWRMRK
ncbi:hypothetical protein [Nitrosopumilus sp.]|uniref:hypothetical protein n=1 Tax=Nitrosopumilus sp. TaxID=2024843 RepID=UPI00247D1767|nr:hypothetical protein [Nitrosopumilus sp.]MCV0409642.1 hypothetical protein [Nitrosopumilus sp.]